MSKRLTFRENPGWFSGELTLVIMIFITICGTFQLVMTTGKAVYFIYGLVLDFIVAIIVGLVVSWRMGTLAEIFRKAPPSGPPPQGVDELVAVRAAGPMQCQYCETSILPSMAVCPKCGRRIF